jgi:hypothetical protein
MVVSKNSLLIILILSICQNYHAQHITKCDTTTTFTAASQKSNVNWPEVGNTKTFCAYIFKAPVDHYIKASISYNLAGTSPSCLSDQYVGVSIDNMPNWEGFSKFCGLKAITAPTVVQSIGNELKLGVSSTDFKQYVNITIETVALAQGKCDCR